MTVSCDQLTQKILEFMSIIHECHAKTNFANDRAIYAQDLMAAMGWLVDLRAEKNPADVAREIKSPRTDMQFGDYWRQGEWGDMAAKALNKLQSSL